MTNLVNDMIVYSMIFVSNLFPGATWMQEIVYLIATDFDYESAGSATIEDRFPYLEYPIPGLKAISAMSSPRFIKSHLPFSLLPKDLTEKKPKVTVCLI